MGTYIPTGRSNRSLYDTLAEAEEDHFLDCPNADLWLRARALLLDGILFFLLNSALLHIAAMVVTYILPPPGDIADAANVKMLVNYAILFLRLLMFFFYFLWSVSHFGGTPAKLLLGLRVIDINSGQRLSPFRALFRELIGKALDVASCGIGLALPLFRPDSRALHDLVSGSVVKKVQGDP